MINEATNRNGYLWSCYLPIISARLAVVARFVVAEVVDSVVAIVDSTVTFEASDAFSSATFEVVDSVTAAPIDAVEDASVTALVDVVVS